MVKSIELTQEEIKIIYGACISYGNELANVMAKVLISDDISSRLNAKAQESYNLAAKITDYMEADIDWF